MKRYWIGVASAAHVRLGRAGGFMQLGHGKRSPLLRLKPGDGIVYYSPSTVFGQADGLSSFTAIGHVLPGEVYQGNMGEAFLPHRRDVAWARAREQPIRPLLQTLELTRDKPAWGMVFRYGLVSISAADFARIADAMEVAWPDPEVAAIG